MIGQMTSRGTIDSFMTARGMRFRLRMMVSGKQQTIGFYDSEADAEIDRLAHVETLAETSADYEGATLEVYGRKVLTAREVSKRVRDPKSDWSRWNLHIKADPIAKVALRRLTTPLLSQWAKRLELKSLERQTRNNCLNILRTVLHEAVEDGLIKANSAIGVKIRGKSLDAWTYLRPEEQMRMLSVCDAQERCIVAVALGTGVRAGELCALRLEDVHLGDRPRIVVRYGKPPSEPTKTNKVRTVPLFGLALQAITAWMPVVATMKNTHGVLFPLERGGYRDEGHVLPWDRWQEIVRQAELGRRFRWHDLRHTCASSLVSGWWGRRWSLMEVKEMLGHTSITTTQRYAHLAESALEEAGRLTSGQVSGSQEHGHNGEGVGAMKLLENKAEEASSHPRESNSRPTVYENEGFQQFDAGIRSPDKSLTFPQKEPVHAQEEGRGSFKRGGDAVVRAAAKESANERVGCAVDKTGGSGGPGQTQEALRSKVSGLSRAEAGSAAGDFGGGGAAAGAVAFPLRDAMSALALLALDAGRVIS